MFFVFFKQKTAYEMRISDWSSDVCSSDLVAAVLALAANAGHDFLIGQELARAAGKHHLRCVLLACEIDELAGDVAAARLARGDGQRQIGRASCRERVCQYV